MSARERFETSTPPTFESSLVGVSSAKSGRSDGFRFERTGAPCPMAAVPDASLEVAVEVSMLLMTWAGTTITSCSRLHESALVIDRAHFKNRKLS